MKIIVESKFTANVKVTVINTHDNSTPRMQSRYKC